MDFKNTDEEKEQVIEYIKQQAIKDNCGHDLTKCQDTRLRELEKDSLAGFKEAIQATDRDIMNKVIAYYCDPNGYDECNYKNIARAYKENYEASKKELTWD